MCISIFKTVFLFVGAVIGAGFATGSEVMLYFGGTGLSSVILSGSLIGVFAIVFALFGKLSNRYKWLDNLLKIAVFFSSFATFCVMISGADEVIRFAFNIKYFGAFTGVIVAFLLLFDMRIIKIINSVIVPFILLLFAVMLIKTGGNLGGGFDPSSSILYASMNMLLGGYMMTREGRNYSVKNILWIGGIIAIIMTTLLGFCYFISMEGYGFSMPLFEVAKRIGLGACAGVIIYLAIFTTLIGAGRVMGDIMCDLGQNKYLFSLLIALVSVLVYSADFRQSVAFIYPPLGWVGVAFTMTTLAIVAVYYVRKSYNRSRRLTIGKN